MTASSGWASVLIHLSSEIVSALSASGFPFGSRSVGFLAVRPPLLELSLLASLAASTSSILRLTVSLRLHPRQASHPWRHSLLQLQAQLGALAGAQLMVPPLHLRLDRSFPLGLKRTSAPLLGPSGAGFHVQMPSPKARKTMSYMTVYVKDRDIGLLRCGHVIASCCCGIGCANAGGGLCEIDIE